MIQRMMTACRRFRRGEEGSATIEFAIVFPAFMLVLMSTVELGLITIRQTMLERAVDLTVRDIRLGTGAAPQHDQIRDMICARSGFIDNCATSLRLEMIQIDPFDWQPVNPVPDCITRIEEVLPVRSFVNGQSNELMYMRACMKFKPMLPQWGLGADLQKDGDGRVSLYAASAFVQEPR